MAHRGRILLAPWHWHIEISSKCTLMCPRCPRQEVPQNLVNTELNLDFFIKNFTPDFIQTHVEKITFCGDDGDPIYAHDLIEVIRYFKSNKPKLSIVIVTNGSYKKKDWWLELSDVLNEYDQIHFSIDGYDQNSNSIYRINSNFDSILLGIETIRKNSKVFMIWDAIGFRFNQDKIEDMKSMATNMGFDQFQLTKSTKFGKIYPNYGSDDELQPDDSLMSFSSRFERIVTNLSGREFTEHWLKTNFMYFQNAKVINNKIKPLCMIGNKGLYINSKGEFYPCCWVANRYMHNSEWLKLGSKYNLYDVELTKVLENNNWSDDVFSEKLECNSKCNVKRIDKNYATQW